MKRWMLYLLVACTSAIWAQQPSEDSGDEAGSQAQAENPCAEFGIVAGDKPEKGASIATGPDAKSGEPAAREGATEAGKSAPFSKACLDFLEARRKAAEEGAGDKQEEGKPDDGAGEDAESRPDDEDFRPDEEISEDYPVPLPSDI